MQHDTEQPPDDFVDMRSGARPIHEGEAPSNYPWFDPDDFDDVSEPDELDVDAPHWDAFLADDDELDPQPTPGDFWPADD